jgi:hypothetical protein
MKLITKFGKLGAAAAAAMLAGGISIAAAQSSMQPKGSAGMANPEGQCWDAASNTVKDKAGSPSGAKTAGSVTTGSSPSGQNNNAKGTGNTQTQVGNASNLPKC